MEQTGGCCRVYAFENSLFFVSSVVRRDDLLPNIHRHSDSVSAMTSINSLVFEDANASIAVTILPILLFKRVRSALARGCMRAAEASWLRWKRNIKALWHLPLNPSF